MGPAGEAVEEKAEAEEDSREAVTDAPATAATAETNADDEAAAEQTAVEAAADIEAAVKTEPIEVEENADEHIIDPAHSLAAREAQAPPSGPLTLPSSLFIGDLRLLALKNRLGTLGIPAQFAGEGVLVCGPGVEPGAKGSIVAVRKLEEGRVVLEGPVSGTYFAVRRELYGSYAQVAA